MPTLKSDMHTGYLIVGTLWVACNAAFLAAGFTENVAATMIAGLITALVATVLLVPIIFVAGGLWGLW